jgi:hypothetical protein
LGVYLTSDPSPAWYIDKTPQLWLAGEGVGRKGGFAPS